MTTRFFAGNANRLGLIALSIASYSLLCGNRSNCDDQRAPAIACQDFSLTVQPGSCATFTNPCADHQWTQAPRFDGFRLCDAPAGVTVNTRRVGNSVTREICVAASAPLYVNESVGFVYGRGIDYGMASLILTTASPIVVSASASPSTINVGQSSQLVANVSGGVPPYFYSWAPDSTLDRSNVAAPIATPPATTVYTVTVTDSANQHASAAVMVNVRAQLSVSANPTAINAGDASALAAIGSGGTPPYSFVWSPAATLDSSTRADPIARPLQTTTYSVTMTDSAGAVLNGSTQVRVNVAVTASANPSTIDQGDQSQLSTTVAGGLPPFTYAWSPSGSLNSASSPNPIATPNTTTTYDVIVTDAQGFSASASVVVNVNIPPPPPVLLTVSATPGTIAVGGSSQLDASASGGVPPYFYSWTPSSSLNATDIASPIASPTVSTRYTVIVTDSIGQTASASVNVGVALEFDVSASPSTINASDSSQLSAIGAGGSPPYTFSWAPVSTLDNPTSSSPVATPANTTTYNVTMSDSTGAQITGSVEVFVNVAVAVSANPQTINAGQTSQLTSTVVGGSAPYTYAWTPADSLDNASSANPVATPNATTTYDVVVTDADGFSANGSVTVTVNAANPPPTAFFTYTITNGPRVNLDATGSTGNIATYTWELSFTPASPDRITTTPTTNFRIREFDHGTITLTVTAVDGQTASFSRPI